MTDQSDDTQTPGAEPEAGHTEEYPTLVYTPPVAGEPPDGDDAEADEEWVVRASGGIRLGLPLAGLLAVLLVAAGFWGGALVEKNHGGSSSGSGAAGLAARFRTARGGTGGTSTTGGGGFSGFGGLGGGSSSATVGTISVVNGNTLYVLTSGGSLVKVTLSSSTTVTRNADSTAVGLRPGDTVVVQGAAGSNGNVAATSVSATAPGVSSTASLFGGGGSTAETTTTTAG
jgi:hypothetical protein